MRLFPKPMRLFLPRVYKTSPLLAICMLIGGIFQGFFTYKGVNTFPFMNYGMYSEPVRAQSGFELVKIRANGVDFRINSLPHIAQDMLLTNIRYYQQLEKSGFRDGLENLVNSRLKGRINDSLLAYCVQQLCNQKVDNIRFNAWLNRFLGQYFESPTPMQAEFSIAWHPY